MFFTIVIMSEAKDKKDKQKEIIFMNILKKELHLNYTENKGQKVSRKSYSFKVNKDVDDSVAKDVGDDLMALFKKQIENCTLTIKESL